MEIGRELDETLDEAREAASGFFLTKTSRCNCTLPVAYPPVGDRDTTVPFFSHGLLCLHEEPTMALLNHVHRSRRCFTTVERERANYVVSLLRARMRWQDRPSCHRKIISIGETCLPKTISTKWGLKAPKSMGEKTMPFDLSIHPMAVVRDVIGDNFASYIDTAALVLDDSANYVTDPSRGIHWNHEVGSSWSDDSFHKFRSVYARRICDFRAAAQGPVLWFASTDRQVELSAVEALCLALGNAYPLAHGTLALLSSDDAQAAGVRPVENLALPVSIFNLPLPRPDYCWYAWEHFSTGYGLDWERAIADWLATLVASGDGGRGRSVPQRVCEGDAVDHGPAVP